MRKTIFIALVSALAMTVPAHAQNREHMQMTADLRILQQQNQELANTLAQMIQLLNDTAKALSTRIDQTNEAIRKGFADQSLTLNATAGDVRRTRRPVWVSSRRKSRRSARRFLRCSHASLHHPIPASVPIRARWRQPAGR